MNILQRAEKEKGEPDPRSRSRSFLRPQRNRTALEVTLMALPPLLLLRNPEDNGNPLKWSWRNTHPAGERTSSERGEKDGGCWRRRAMEGTRKKTTIPNEYAESFYRITERQANGRGCPTYMPALFFQEACKPTPSSPALSHPGTRRNTEIRAFGTSIAAGKDLHINDHSEGYFRAWKRHAVSIRICIKDLSYLFLFYS